MRTKVLGISLAAGVGIVALGSSAIAGPVDERVDRAALAGQSTKAGPEMVIKVDKSLVVVGKSVSVTGKIDMPKSVAGDRAIIRQKTGDKPWKTQDRVRVTKKGRFTWTDRPSTPQARKYKVVLPETEKHDRVVSNSLHVTAARWESLAVSHEPVDAASDHPDGDMTVRVVGIAYRHSIGTSFWDGSTSGALEYNLYRKCFAIRSAAALDDSAETASAGTVRILLDGEGVYTEEVSELGLVLPVQEDLTDVYRMRVEFERTTPERRPSISLLSPQVLCTR